MRIEVSARDNNSQQPFYTAYANGVGSSLMIAGVNHILFGDTIEVKVKTDDGTFLGQWTARNVFAAKVISVIQFDDGVIAVTDNASNTYTKEVKDAA